MDLEEVKKQLAAAQSHGFAKFGVTASSAKLTASIEEWERELEDLEDEVSRRKTDLEEARDEVSNVEQRILSLRAETTVAEFREWAVHHLGEDGCAISEHDTTAVIINKLADAVEQEEEFRRRQTTLEF